MAAFLRQMMLWWSLSNQEVTAGRGNMYQIIPGSARFSRLTDFSSLYITNGLKVINKAMCI